MGGVSLLSFFKVFLSVSFLVLSLMITSCGENKSAPSEQAVSTPATLLGLAYPSDLLKAEFIKKGLSADGHCFRLVDPGNGRLRILEVYALRCEDIGGASQPLLSLEAREWVNPEKVGVPTDTFILYEQLLPVGEVKKDRIGWTLSDLCSVEEFYRTACELKARDERLDGIDLNPVSVVNQLRLRKRLAEENKTLKSENEKNKASLVALNSHLQKLSGEISSQKEGIKMTLNAMEPVLAKEEKRVLERLKGVAGTPGLEAQLGTLTTEIQVLSSELAQISQALAETQKAYLEKQKAVLASEKALDESMKERASLKAKLEAAAQEEESTKLKSELEAFQLALSAQIFALADEKEALGRLLSDLQADPNYVRESVTLKKLGELKLQSGEVQKKVGQGVEKLNAIAVVKNHLATAGKLLSDNKLAETAIILPNLGKFFERMTSNPF